MFLEWWMIGIIAIATGLWSEYRNIVGRGTGVNQGAAAMLQILLEDKIIDIDESGKIKPVTNKRGNISARRPTKSKGNA